MKRFPYLAVFLLTGSSGTLAQGSFLNVYTSATNGCTGKAAIQTSDGGYAVTGQSTGFPSYIDVFLMKTDASGNMLWFKTYGTGDLFTIDDTGHDVQQTNDGGFVIAAESQGSLFGQVYIIKTTGSGDTVWTRQFTYATGFGDGFSIRQTADSGFIVAGTGSLLTGFSDPEAALIKLDKDGYLQWSKLFGGPGADIGVSAKQTDDGGYVLVSKTSNGGNEDVRLVRIEETGDTAWVRTFGSPLTDIPEDVIQTSDGGFLVTGRTDVNAPAEKFLLKTNGDGDLQWVKTYGSGWVNSVMETANGYVFGGYGLSTSSMLTATDFNGNVLWAAHYGLGPTINTYKYSLAADGGYITAGNYNSGSVIGLMLMKTEANGLVACGYTDATAVTSELAATFGATSGCAVNVVMPTATFATVINANPAPDDTVVVCNTLSVSNAGRNEQVKAYPVPANERVTLSFEQPFSDKAFAEVSDVLGRTVMKVAVEPAARVLNLDVSELPAGAYVVVVSSRETLLVKKIHVQR